MYYEQSRSPSPEKLASLGEKKLATQLCKL